MTTIVERFESPVCFTVSLIMKGIILVLGVVLLFMVLNCSVVARASRSTITKLSLLALTLLVVLIGSI